MGFSVGPAIITMDADKTEKSVCQELNQPRARLRRWQFLTVGVIFVAYIGVLLNRRGLSAVLPVMRNDSSINLDAAGVGVIYAVGNAAHLVAEFCAGPIVDRLGGRVVFMVATFMPAVATVAFSFSRILPLWAICIGLGRIFQACVPPANAKLVSQWFRADEFGRAMGVISSSTRIGAASAGIVLGSLMFKGGLTWSYAMLVAAGFLGGASMLGWILLKPNPESLGLSLSLLDAEAEKKPAAVEDKSQVTVTSPRTLMSVTSPRSTNIEMAGLLSDVDSDHFEEPQPPPPVPRSASCYARLCSACIDDDDTPSDEPQPLLKSLARFIRSPRFWLVAISTAGIWVLFEFDVYLPLFLSDELQVDPAVASMAASAQPIGMFTSMTLGGMLLDKLGRRRGGWLVFGSFCGSVCVMGAFWVLTRFELLNLGIGVTLAFLHGLTMGLPAYMPSSLFALRFGGKHECATLVGVLEASGFLLLIGFNLVSGYLTGGEDGVGGWTPLFILMICVGLVALVALWCFTFLDGRVADRIDERLAALKPKQGALAA